MFAIECLGAQISVTICVMFYLSFQHHVFGDVYFSCVLFKQGALQSLPHIMTFPRQPQEQPKITFPKQNKTQTSAPDQTPTSSLLHAQTLVLDINSKHWLALSRTKRTDHETCDVFR